MTEKTLPHLRNPEILIGENDLTSLSYLNEPEGRCSGWVGDTGGSGVECVCVGGLQGVGRGG